jgi:Zn-finger in Ran binding protein and others
MTSASDRTTWVCDTCHSNNRATDTSCVVCDRPRITPTMAPTTTPTAPWVCAKCHANNPQTQITCDVCGSNKRLSVIITTPPKKPESEKTKKDKRPAKDSHIIRPSEPTDTDATRTESSAPDPKSTSKTDTHTRPKAPSTRTGIRYFLAIVILGVIGFNFFGTSPLFVETINPATISYEVTLTRLSNKYPLIAASARELPQAPSPCFQIELIGNGQNWYVGDRNTSPSDPDLHVYARFAMYDTNTWITEICPDVTPKFRFTDNTYSVDLFDETAQAVAIIEFPSSGIIITVNGITSSQTTTNNATLSNQELTFTAITQPSATQPRITPQPTKQPAPAAQRLYITLDPANGRDDPNCVSMGITGIDTLYWRMRVQGSAIEPAIFDGSGNARLCNEWIGQQTGFYIDVVNANFESVPGGSVPAVGGDIFKAQWITP